MKLADLAPNAVHEKLSRLMVGGCTCLTKTPELRFHDQRCTYRLAAEITDLLCTTEVSAQSTPQPPAPLADQARPLSGS